MRDVVKKLGKKTIRKLLIKFLNEGDALVTGNLAITDFLGCIVTGSTKTKLRQCCVVMVRINFVIDAAVF